MAKSRRKRRKRIETAKTIYVVLFRRGNEVTDLWTRTTISDAVDSVFMYMANKLSRDASLNSLLKSNQISDSLVESLLEWNFDRACDCWEKLTAIDCGVETSFQILNNTTTAVRPSVIKNEVMTILCREAGKDRIRLIKNKMNARKLSER